MFRLCCICFRQESFCSEVRFEDYPRINGPLKDLLARIQRVRVFNAYPTTISDDPIECFIIQTDCREDVWHRVDKVEVVLFYAINGN